MKVFVFGLWHLGPVTAARCAEHFDTVASDPSMEVTAGLREGRQPVIEPGLAEKLELGRAAGRLQIVDDLEDVATCDVAWICFDTPLDAAGAADAKWLRARIDRLAPHLAPGALVLISSQVPLGFARETARRLAAARPEAGVGVACVPENLQLGRAVEGFTRAYAPVGTEDGEADSRLAALLAPFVERMDWMSLESAELAKHATNAFLATSVALTNELARVGELAGADAAEVERVLRAEPRIGPKAYVRPGEPFDGATLQRDVATVIGLGAASGIATPLLDGVLASNDLHRDWAQSALERLVGPLSRAEIAVLGLAAKVETDSLRGSGGAALARWLVGEGATVRIADPAVRALPEDLAGAAQLHERAEDALAGADAAVVATPWPEFRDIRADMLTATMRRPVVVDAGGFVSAELGDEEDVEYVRVGRPAGD